MEKKKIQHHYGVSQCSYGVQGVCKVCKICLRFHYDSCRQRYDLINHVSNTPIHPDSYERSRMATIPPTVPTHGSAKNEPDPATVELRIRPRPQSTTIHSECFKRFKIVVALPGRFPNRQDSPRIITVLLRFMPISLLCYYESCRCATI